MNVNRKLALAGLLSFAVLLGQAPAVVQLHGADINKALIDNGAAANDRKSSARPAPASMPIAPPNPGDEADQTQGGDNSNPYAIIGDRNVFRLNPPLPPAAAETKPIDVPAVNLSGFRKTGSEIYVYLAMKPKDPKEGFQYFKLREGEKGGAWPNTLELVKVHFDAETVDIINSGTAMTLSLKSNSFASASAPAKGAPGGAPGENPMRRRMMPGMAPGAPPAVPPVRPFAPQPAPPTGAIPSTGGGGTVVAGALPLSQTQSYSYGAQTQVYGAVTPSPSSTYYGGSGANTVVAGGPQVNVTGANGTALDLNPSVPARTAQAQINWPPTIQASPEEQAAALLVHEAAGGPPAPPGLMPEEPGNATGPPSIPVGPVRIR
jgi:hypothetical protein